MESICTVLSSKYPVLVEIYFLIDSETGRISFQNVQNATPLETTVYLLPMAVMGFIVNVGASFLVVIFPGRLLLLVASGSLMVNILIPCRLRWL